MKPKVFKITKTGLEIFLRPVEESDESLVKNFFVSLSAESLRRRFLSVRKNMLDYFLYNFFIVDSSKEMKILVIINQNKREEIVGVGQFHTYSGAFFSEVALVVSDSYQNKGIGRELLTYMVQLAKKDGLRGFEAIVQIDNWPILHLCQTIGLGAFDKIIKLGAYELKMYFDKR